MRRRVTTSSVTPLAAPLVIVPQPVAAAKTVNDLSTVFRLSILSSRERWEPIFAPGQPAPPASALALIAKGANLPAMRIRPFQDDDPPALAALFHAAVTAIAAGHYAPEQIRAWSPAPADPARFAARGRDGRTLLVAVDSEDRPIAYGDVEEDGHIDHFYCAPDHAGTGVTAALYRALEAAARARGIARLHVEASEPARLFFLKQGFAVLHRRDFAIGGVPIHNYAMAKVVRPA
jgi:putative acetyltransferase